MYALTSECMVGLTNIYGVNLNMNHLYQMKGTLEEANKMTETIHIVLTPLKLQQITFSGFLTLCYPLSNIIEPLKTLDKVEKYP